MSRGFYNYDTRGASASSQIINLERMVEERDQTIERLREVLKKLEYYSDGTIRRYPDESEVEAALRQEEPK